MRGLLLKGLEERKAEGLIGANAHVYVRTGVYVHACPCGLACVYVKVLEVSKGPNITQIRKRASSYSRVDCLSQFPSSSCASASVCASAGVVVRRAWGGGIGGGWRAKESFNNLATNICIPQSTGGLFFALLYLSKEKERGGEKVGNVQKAAHFCVFVCRDLCVQLQTFIMSAFPLIDPLIKNMNNGGIKKMLSVVSRPH